MMRPLRTKASANEARKADLQAELREEAQISLEAGRRIAAIRYSHRASRLNRARPATNL